MKRLIFILCLLAACETKPQKKDNLALSARSTSKASTGPVGRADLPIIDLPAKIEQERVVISDGVVGVRDEAHGLNADAPSCLYWAYNADDDEVRLFCEGGLLSALTNRTPESIRCADLPKSGWTEHPLDRPFLPGDCMILTRDGKTFWIVWREPGRGPDWRIRTKIKTLECE